MIGGGELICRDFRHLGLGAGSHLLAAAPFRAHLCIQYSPGQIEVGQPQRNEGGIGAVAVDALLAAVQKIGQRVLVVHVGTPSPRHCEPGRFDLPRSATMACSRAALSGGYLASVCSRNSRCGSIRLGRSGAAPGGLS